MGLNLGPIAGLERVTSLSDADDRRDARDPDWRPRDHVPGFFSALDAAIRDGGYGLSAAQGEVSAYDAGRLAIADRGVTILQAARLLLEESHWEAASVVARQLFELLVNTEHLAAQPDTEAAWTAYKSFGLMALARGRKRTLDYAIKQGYRDDDGQAQKLDEFLQQSDFDQFRDKNGKLLDNWARLTVADLAAASPNDLRVAQYEYYYRTWSEHAHARQSSLMPAIIPRPECGAVELIMDSVHLETRRLIVMLISMFTDLILVLGQPQLVATEQFDSWRESLAEANKTSGEQQQA